MKRLQEIRLGMILWALAFGLAIGDDRPTAAGEPSSVLAASFQDEIVGLGLQLRGEPSPGGFIEIVAVIPQASEEVKAAIKAADLITHVDGASVVGKSIDQVIEMIRGPEGTKVKLTLQRRDVDKAIEVALTRTKIRLEP